MIVSFINLFKCHNHINSSNDGDSDGDNDEDGDA